MTVKGRYQRVAFWCWYRGQRFHGYQRQLDVRTVQGELLRAFQLAGLNRNPVVAGRTDKGVSARMQVLSARLEGEVALEDVASRLNEQLPEDVGIALACHAHPGFHAAWSSSSKEYRYSLSSKEVGDLELLQQAAALIPGTRDFKVFHFKSSKEKPRTVNSVEVCLGPDQVSLRFVGEGFARHMVRMLVGGMTAVSQGSVSLETFRAGLCQQRPFHCPTAAAEPLTLWSVGYPLEVDPFTNEHRRTVGAAVERILGGA